MQSDTGLLSIDSVECQILIERVRNHKICQLFNIIYEKNVSGLSINILKIESLGKKPLYLVDKKSTTLPQADGVLKNIINASILMVS